jgi:hypothetical protein
MQHAISLASIYICKKKLVIHTVKKKKKKKKNCYQKVIKADHGTSQCETQQSVTTKLIMVPLETSQRSPNVRQCHLPEWLMGLT